MSMYIYIYIYIYIWTLHTSIAHMPPLLIPQMVTLFGPGFHDMSTSDCYFG